MANNSNMIPIPGRLHSVATDGQVAGANEIQDDAQNKKQSTINSELINAVGSGGSVDSRIADAKAEIIGDAATDYNTLGKLEDKVQAEASRAEGAESALDGRVDTLEDAVGTGGSVDSRISAAVATETTRAQAAEADRYTKSETYTKTEVNGLVDTPHQEYVTVATYASLPASGSADTIYRVSSYDGANSQVDDTVYSEYAWNGTQYVFLCVKSQIEEVFDITVYNNNTKYADLASALGVDGANIPATLRRGGMSVKFVQSSDNKYVQYRLMANTFSTTTTDWQGVDNKPTNYSKNLVESEGIYDEFGFISQNITLTSADFAGVFDNNGTIVNATAYNNGLVFKLYPNCKYKFPVGVTVQNSYPKAGDTRDSFYPAWTEISVDNIKYAILSVNLSSFNSFTYYQKEIGSKGNIKELNISESFMEKEIGVSSKTFTSDDFSGLFFDETRLIITSNSQNYNGIIVRLLKDITYKTSKTIGIINEYPIVGGVCERMVSANTEFSVDNNCYGVINIPLSTFSSVSLICNSTGIRKDIEELKNASSVNILTNNLLLSSLTTTTHNGITFTVNSDGSIVCTGTATGNGAVGVLCNGYHLDAGKYIISGLPKNSAYYRPHLVVYPPYISGGTAVCDDYIFEVTDDYVDRVQIFISVPTGFVCNGDEFSTFRPMVRKFDEKDGTYIKYGETPNVNIPIQSVVNTSLLSWYNKKIVVLGDSIAKGAGGDWIAKSSIILSLGDTKNYAVGGSRMAYYGDGGSVTADDSVVAKVSEIDADADIILIHAGTNDSASQVPLGNENSVDRLEFNGALNIIMSYIREHHPYALVIFDTIMDRYNYDNSSIFPIGQSQYSECIKNMCAKYHFLYWDIYKELGVDIGWDYSNQNYNYTMDGLHPNNMLSSIMARKFSAFVNNH